MTGICKRDFDEVLSELGDGHFYIFGNGIYAHIFYFYCCERGMEQHIKAFLVSDRKRTKKASYTLHGIPLQEITCLSKEKGYHIFLAAREKTIQEQILSVFEPYSECSVYYVSDFVNNMMLHRCMYMQYEKIIRKYRAAGNLYEKGYVNISEPGSTDYYKYIPRIFQGALPDAAVFGRDGKLDALYREQLQDYDFIREPKETYDTGLRCRIYMAKSHADRELRENYDTPYTETIQVGADLTDAIIAKLRDNVGDNISGRNRDYCEMSAVYWAWKNDRENDYIGLCHYRRRFVLSENMVQYIMANNYDAVYTVPELVDGGMREEFVERNHFLTPEMWDVTGEAVSRLFPSDAEVWHAFRESYFLIVCNMFIMRKTVFDDYCTWVFSILKEVEWYFSERGIENNNRYLGYIAECLTTVYVMKNKDTLKKGYVEFKLLETTV